MGTAATVGLRTCRRISGSGITADERSDDEGKKWIDDSVVLKKPIPNWGREELAVVDMKSQSRFLGSFSERGDDDLQEEPLLQAEEGGGPGYVPLETESRSWWSTLTFSWVTPLMDIGSVRQLTQEDLFPLPKEMSPNLCCGRLYSHWEEEKKKGGSPSLLKPILRTYGRAWLAVGVLKVVNDSLSFLGPVFLNGIVNFLETQNKSLLYGYGWAVGLGIVSVVRAFLGAHYTNMLLRVRLQLKASISAMIYQKALCVSLAERSCFSSGEIQTFMSVDAERVANLVNCGHELWSLPLQMGVALWMLYMQVKFAFVAGLGVIILLIPVNKWLANLICVANDLMMKEKDERIRRMNELLMYIRTLKMYTWEKLFVKRIMQIRKQEMKYLATRKYLDAWCVYFWACTPSIFSLLTFGLFVSLGYKLTASTVFTSLALFNILISPLNCFPWVINGLVEAQVSLGRLCKFLSLQDVDSEWTKDVLLLSQDGNGQPAGVPPTKVEINGGEPAEKEDRLVTDTAILMHSAAFSWSHSRVEDPQWIISEIFMAVPAGSLVVILGKVGSGKSSLLNSILGEMRCVQGSMLVRGRLAYVAQTPWIQCGTFCDNVLFGQPFDIDRYKRVLDACALDVDIQQMQGGDLAEIGERGLNLSGGQRARLSLARALYQDCDTYLLDDPISAVDAHVAAWILEHAIAGPLMSGKTRILCTHHTQAVPMADIVIVMEEGRIRYCGSPRSDSSLDLQKLESESVEESEVVEQLCSDWVQPEIPASPPVTLGASQQAPKSGNSKPSALPITLGEQSLRGLSHFMSPTNHVFGSGLRGRQGKAKMDDESGRQQAQTIASKAVKLITEEDRNEGHVQSTVYRSYGRFVGWFVIATILISISLTQATRNGGDMWLTYWVDHEDDDAGKSSLHFYLNVFIWIAVANSLVTLVRAFSFAYGGLNAASGVHKTLLQKVTAAPVRFFDQNPSGRILNRFASDQYTVDDSLPFVVNNLIAQLFGLIGIVAVLCWVQWTFLLVLIPLGFIYNRLQRYYRATSRELRRLDGITRSPIYTSFTEALEGAPTIRSFRAQAQFAATNRGMVGVNMRASYNELSASLWLSIRLQMLAALVVLLVSVMAILSHHEGSTIAPVSAGLVGLGLSYASPIITTLNNLLANFTETEKDMVSMERIHQYMGLEPEPSGGTVEVAPDWPSRGEIEFCKVTLVYLPNLPPALRELSFKVYAGEKVGIAGRTGAGKSSILGVLFRLIPLTGGHILIDGVDTSSVALGLLRSRLSVVPQAPMLFEGTIRENLDPTGTSSDGDLWKMLDKCHVRETISAAGGLDLRVSECGESLSVGQRQLLCLARALLSTSPILCLDECTANIDPETTTLLMETVASECKGMTVLTIAHRIATIMDLDRVLIMDHGSLVEAGNPQELLANSGSKFFNLVRVSGSELL
ncbi:hypothetical protein R1sor_013186 [Riccia sorocarpa]|uniref:ABC-type xenobiotic transporter n=1 Tax=Riccia sorocarpa TaxID=122646 RepID=A0ABD3H8Q9_9MARC